MSVRYRKATVQVWCERNVAVGTEVRPDLHEVCAEDADGWAFSKSHKGADGHYSPAWFVAVRHGKGWQVIDPRSGLPQACGKTRDKAVDGFLANRFGRWEEATNDGRMEPYVRAFDLAKSTNAHPVIRRSGGMVAYGAVVYEGDGTGEGEYVAFGGPVEMGDLCQALEDARRPEPEPDPEPVEVVEDVPAEAYADVDARARPRARREDGVAKAICDAMDDAYDYLYSHDIRDEVVRELEGYLVDVGDNWMHDHPRMFRRICRERGDTFMSDREVAALGMVMARRERRERREGEAAA